MGRLSGALPDFLLIGVPKAGTTALHAALAGHPELLLSPVKEPKFFLCDGRPPRGQRGPGDAHSAQEWIWRRDRYEALFAGPADRLRGESTPFYLYDREAQQRMAALVPDAKLVAIVRDPVDRAYSNWLHAWSDGLEPVGDFATACSLEQERVDAGWAPFWHYLRVGRYGEQLRDLAGLFPAEQLLLLRYRELVDDPVATLDRVCRFLGVTTGAVRAVPGENSRGFVRPSARARALGSTIRLGAAAGAHLPPRAWRVASVPLVRALQAGAEPRPRLDPAVRAELAGLFADDVRLLEVVTGQSFADWLTGQGRGEFKNRTPPAPVGTPPAPPG